MSQKNTLPRTRQQRHQEALRRREKEQRRAVRTRRLTPIRTITVMVLVIAGLLAFVLSERQALANSVANSAYPPVGTISCDSGEQTDFHVHAHLTLYINGQKSVVPAGVGIAPDGSCFYWLHTHNTDGVIHIEAPSGSAFTLKNFLDIWAGHFSTLGYPSQLDQTSGWQAYVNGKPFPGDFHTITLHAHTLITLVYNSPGVKPDTSFTWNGL